LRILRRYDSDSPEWIIDVNLVKVFEHFFSKFDLDYVEIEQLSGTTTTTVLIEEINKLPTRSVNLDRLLEQLKQYDQIEDTIKGILERSLPYFMYFSNYDRMEGAVQIDHLNQLKADKDIEKEEFKGFRLFDEFLEYAGVPIAEITSIGTYETFNAKLEAASNNITD
jgi:hypothetical protein